MEAIRFAHWGFYGFRNKLHVFGGFTAEHHSCFTKAGANAKRAIAQQFNLCYSGEDLRPGGTVSGPTMFTVADCAFYAALLGMIGRKAMAVTTNLNMTFLRKPPKAAVIGEARILKLGRNLASGDVLVYSDGMDKAVAHAAVTYAIPSKL